MRLETLIAACVIAAPAIAQERPEQHCGPLAGMLEYLQSRYDEFKIWTGEAGGSHYTVTRAHNGGWTLIKSEGDASCIVAVGKTSEVDRGL